MKSGLVNSTVSASAYTISYGTAETPTLSLSTGDAQSVTLATATAGAAIYYTTDGNTPTTGSNLYSSPFTISNDGASHTIKAIAVKSQLQNSAVGSATYQSAAAPTYTFNDGTSSTDQTVSISSATASPTIYYTIDNATPTTSSSTYGTPVWVIEANGAMTVKAFTVAAGKLNSTVSSVIYQPANTPSFSAPAGSYTSDQTVSITSSGSDAIRYTTDGITAPTTSSTLYSGSLSIAGSIAGVNSTTVKAIAIKTGYITKSAEATYNITYPQVATPTVSLSGGNVSLSTTTAGAAIRYTTDGSTPTGASSLYSSAITGLTGPGITIQAIATKAAMITSDVGSATYYSAADPSFVLNAGTTAANQTVTVSTTTSNSTLRYTTDGSTPTNASATYTTPLTAIGDSGAKTIKAFATSTGYLNSNVSSVTYQPATAPSFSVPGGSYDLTQSVALSSSGSDYVFYTTDNSTPSTSNVSFSSNIPVGNGTTTIKAIAYRSGYLTTSASATYVITLPQAATPTFSLSAGDTQAMSLSTTSAGATIYYTTDGSTPTTNSPAYTDPFSVTDGATIKAIAVKDQMADSAVGSTTISTAAAPTFSLSAGTSSTDQTVTISSTTASPTIYYTTDTTTPNSSSSTYGTPVWVIEANGAMTVKAFTTAAGKLNSASTSVTYQLTNTPSFSVPRGAYTTDQSVTITSSGSTAIRYTTNNTAPTTSSSLYGSSVSILGSTSGLNTTVLNAIAIRSGYITTSNSVTYDITYPTAATPTFSISGGNVSIATTTAGATIRYTLNGSTPTGASTLYSGTINGYTGTNIAFKAIALKSDKVTSAVGSQTYTSAAAPTFSLSAGTSATDQTVTVSTTTGSPTLYYTTDGTTPTNASATYAAPLSVLGNNGTATIKSYTGATGYLNSSVSTAMYSAISTPSFNPVAGSYNAVQSVALSSTGATAIYYTTDGSTPTTSSNLYSSSISVGNGTTTIKSIAIRSGFLTTSASATYVVTLPLAATPAFSPTPGSYVTSVSVTLTSATAGASIYYTTNGTTPTPGSTLYSSPFTISASIGTQTTVKAIAIRSGYSDSLVATGIYTSAGPTCLSTSTPITWTAASTWNCAGSTRALIAGDSLQIVSPHVVTINSGYTIPQINNITIDNGATLIQGNNATQTILGTLTVSGMLTHSANSTESSSAPSYAVKFTSVGVNVTGTGLITADGKGNTGGNGTAPGLGGVNNSDIHYSGASHSGYGARTSYRSANAPYCTIINPATMGSGGVNGYHSGSGGTGGGLIILNAGSGDFVLAGTITAKAATATGDSSGGAGGGIKLTGTNFSGSGSINVSGGDILPPASLFTGGGGGGCVLVDYTGANTMTPTLTLKGGKGGEYGRKIANTNTDAYFGGSGLALIRKNGAGGTLYANNAGNTGALTLQSDNLSIDTLSVSNGAYLQTNGKSLTLTQSLPDSSAYVYGVIEVNGSTTFTTPLSANVFSIGTKTDLIYHRGATWTSSSSVDLAVSGIFDQRDFTAALSALSLRSLSITSTGVVTHGKNPSSTQSHVLKIDASNNINVQASGQINVDRKGHASGLLAGGSGFTGYGAGPGVYTLDRNVYQVYVSGAGHGGAGGSGRGGIWPGGSAYCSISSPATLGSGGGYYANGNQTADATLAPYSNPNPSPSPAIAIPYDTFSDPWLYGLGGDGGGLVILTSPSITVNGKISANGGTATNIGSSNGGGSGGAGGGIYISATNIYGTNSANTFTANGGNASSAGTSGNGGGGGGCVRVEATNPSSFTTSAISVTGGSYSNDAAAGSVGLKAVVP